MAALAGAGPVLAQAIYRCDDGKGGVLYSDARCANGATVDLLPGKADPAAIERLQRERRAFDERQAARDARAHAEAQSQRESRAQRERQRADDARAAESSAAGSYPGYAWGGYWPWPPVQPRRPRPPRPGFPEPSSASHVPATTGSHRPIVPPVAPAPRPR